MEESGKKTRVGPDHCFLLRLIATPGARKKCDQKFRMINGGCHRVIS
jgi:hypothetical protein